MLVLVKLTNLRKLTINYSQMHELYELYVVYLQFF